MADQLIFTRGFDHTDERQRLGARSARTVRNRSSAQSAIAGHAFIWLVLGVFTIVGIVLLFQYVVAPRMVMRTYHVESDLNVPSTTILRIAGLDGTHYFFKVDPQVIQKRLQAWAPVKHATVVKVFPDTLRISVEGRQPVGVAMAEENGREAPVAFDEDGVVFAIGKKVADLDLPVFSGIKFKNFSLGVKLPPMLTEFIREVHQLKLSSPALYDLISEYKIIPRNDHEFDVLLYPVHHHVAVEIGPHINRTLCMYILRSLQVMDREGALGKVKEIDFRTSDVVYTMDKEG